jgi:hypothetical protein
VQIPLPTGDLVELLPTRHGTVQRTDADREFATSPPVMERSVALRRHTETICVDDPCQPELRQAFEVCTSRAVLLFGIGLQRDRHDAAVERDTGDISRR